MSDDGVKQLTERLFGDSSFRNEFFADKMTTMNNSGYPLTDDEKNAFMNITPKDIVISIKRDSNGDLCGVEYTILTL